MKKFVAILAAAAMTFSLAACGTKTQSIPDNTTSKTDTGENKEQDGTDQSSSDTVLIGGLAPLTGEVAVYGTTATNGAKLAFDEINANGGILGGKKIQYEVLDEKGDSIEAVNAFNKLVDQGMVALIGDITSKPSIAVAEVSQETGIPMITPTGTAKDITTYGPNVFRVCFIDPFQGETMAQFASKNLEAKKVAVMYNTSDDYSDGVATAFKEKAEALGMEVVAYEGYAATDVDFKTQLTNIEQANPDAIMLPDYYAKVALIASQAREIGIDVPLMGADGWDGVATVVDKNSYDVIENSYFCNHYSTQDTSEVVQSFIKNYTEKYGEAPSSFAALGYDAAYVMANAIDKAGSTDKQAITDAVAATDYQGVTGKMTFDENRNPIKSVSIIKIVNGEYTFDSIVEPE